jgi:hypothetical protein
MTGYHASFRLLHVTRKSCCPAASNDRPLLCSGCSTERAHQVRQNHPVRAHAPLDIADLGGRMRKGLWRATPDEDEHYTYAVAL